VPQIEPNSDAGVGEIATININELPKQLKAGDLVVCRFTAPLISTAIKLILGGVPSKVRGRDIGQSLAQLCRKVSGKTLEEWLKNFLEYIGKRILTLENSNRAASADNLRDQREAIVSAYDDYSALCGTLNEFIDKLIDLFADGIGDQFVVFSTIHRAKGDESDNVFILGSNILPYLDRCKLDWQREQEENLAYVALTRAKKKLTFVPLPDKSINSPNYGGFGVMPVPMGQSVYVEQQKWEAEDFKSLAESVEIAMKDNTLIALGLLCLSFTDEQMDGIRSHLAECDKFDWYLETIEPIKSLLKRFYKESRAYDYVQDREIEIESMKIKEGVLLLLDTYDYPTQAANCIPWSSCLLNTDALQCGESVVVNAKAFELYAVSKLVGVKSENKQLLYSKDYAWDVWGIHQIKEIDGDVAILMQGKRIPLDCLMRYGN